MFREIFPEFVYDNILDVDNESILSYCLSWREHSPGRKISNVGGWQSHNIQDEDLAETPLRMLSQVMKSVFYDVFEEAGYKTDGKQIYLDAWININGRGHYNDIHVHHNSMLSAVYYVKVPEYSGNLKLYRNTGTFSKFYGKDLVNHKNTSYTNSVVEFVPVEKSVLIFPSYIPHSVDASSNYDERVSIAFNSVLN